MSYWKLGCHWQSNILTFHGKLSRLMVLSMNSILYWLRNGRNGKASCAILSYSDRKRLTDSRTYHLPLHHDQ
jgi:hypothetical protein